LACVITRRFSSRYPKHPIETVKGFAPMMKKPGFPPGTRPPRLELDGPPREKIEKFVNDVFKTPPAVVEKLEASCCQNS